jgi:hypothetical protein
MAIKSIVELKAKRGRRDELLSTAIAEWLEVWPDAFDVEAG